MVGEIIKVSEFTIEAVHKKAVTPFIEKWHYSHYAGGIQHRQCFALYSPDGMFGLPKMIGAMIYGQPAMPDTAKKYHPDVAQGSDKQRAEKMFQEIQQAYILD